MSSTMPVYYSSYPLYHHRPVVLQPEEAFPMSPEQVYYYHQHPVAHRPHPGAYSYENAFVAAQAMQQLSRPEMVQPQFVTPRDVNNKFRSGNRNYPDLKATKIQETSQTTVAAPRRRVYKFKRRAKSEKKSWTRNEIVLALQACQSLLHKDLKTITKAIYACIDRKPGKCWGRGAEKKLKRILGFQNWRTADKVQIAERVDLQLRKYGAHKIPEDSQIHKVAHKLSLQE